MEEVREYTYLGYKMKFNEEQTGHVRDRVKKGVALLGQVWGIGKRRFGKEVRERDYGSLTD